MGKREVVALLNLSSWCLRMVEQLFLAVPQGCLRFVIVVFPDHPEQQPIRDDHAVRVQWFSSAAFDINGFLSSCWGHTWFTHHVV